MTWRVRRRCAIAALVVAAVSLATSAVIVPDAHATPVSAMVVEHQR